MSVDSQAAFRAEAIRLGVSEAHVDSLISKGIRSFSLFAFISSYQPGAADEKPFVDALVAKLGEEVRECLPAFRHLFYTSHTLAVQELKDKFEPREEAKRLSMADRVDRLERLRKSLPGMTIDTWLEPSHALVDKAVSFAEEQCLGPLELSKCTSREAEMRSEKRDPVTFKLEQLNIKVTKNHAAVTADTSTDLHVRTRLRLKRLRRLLLMAQQTRLHPRAASPRARDSTYRQVPRLVMLRAARFVFVATARPVTSPRRSARVVIMFAGSA